MKAFEIFVNGRYFDTLYFGSNKSIEDVRKSLKITATAKSVTIKRITLGYDEF
jgi:hypothetical protein